VCRFTFGAPTILVVAYDKERDWKNRLMPGYGSGETDAAIVCTHMMLAAWEQGIGSCWVGYFNAEDVSRTLGLPENIVVTAMLPIGYPAENAEPLALHSSFRDRDDTVSEI
jgi:nitroreductase